MVYKPCPECGKLKHNHHNKLKCAESFSMCILLCYWGCGQVFHSSNSINLACVHHISLALGTILHHVYSSLSLRNRSTCMHVSLSRETNLN